MAGRRPKWREVRRFCELQGFVASASDHDFFDKTFPNGETAGTTISRGVEGETLSPARWALVWKRQLRLTSEDDFWRGLEGGPVVYAIPSPPPAAEPLPAYLSRFLAETEYLDAAVIAGLTRDEALARYHAHLAREMRGRDDDG